MGLWDDYIVSGTCSKGHKNHYLVPMGWTTELIPKSKTKYDCHCCGRKVSIDVRKEIKRLYGISLKRRENES